MKNEKWKIKNLPACKRFLTFGEPFHGWNQTLRLAYWCRKLKGRDTLIYIDAPGRRYFAKQNFHAQISHAKACKVKKQDTNNLHTLHMICAIEWRRKRCERPCFAPPKTVNTASNGGLRASNRRSIALQKVVFCKAKGCKRQRRRP